MVVIFMSSRGFSKCVVAIIFLLLIWPHMLNRLPLLTAFVSNINRGLEVLLYRVRAGRQRSGVGTLTSPPPLVLARALVLDQTSITNAFPDTAMIGVDRYSLCQRIPQISPLLKRHSPSSQLSYRKLARTWEELQEVLMQAFRNDYLSGCSRMFRHWGYLSQEAA